MPRGRESGAALLGARILGVRGARHGRFPCPLGGHEKDRQIGLEYAHQAYDQLVNSPRSELKVFTEREGGVEHVGADNMSYARDYIADWFAETLGGATR